MTKSTISKIWITGFLLFAAGLIVGGISLGIMLAYGGHFTPAPNGNGSDFVPHTDNSFWTPLAFTIAGFVIVAAGGIVQLAAWIGSLVNSYRLPDKTWFVVLLIGGLIGMGVPLVGFGAMIAYLIAGQDGMVTTQVSTPRPLNVARQAM